MQLRHDNMSDIFHIIVAAGKGNRFGADKPKQFCLMAGRPVLMETIDRMRQYGLGGEIILVLSHEMTAYWADLCKEYGFESPRVAEGGDTRWQSVKNALELIDGTAKIVTVHDGARPLVTKRIIESVISAVARGHSGALPAVAVTDSMRQRSANSFVAVDRSSLRAVQTPQAFRADILRQAYSQPYRDEFTDDASVVESMGINDIELTEGDQRNIKITHPADIRIAEIYLSDN